MRRWRNTFLLIGLLAVVALLMLSVPRASNKDVGTPMGSTPDAMIVLPVEQQLRQGINECGPYSVAAALAAMDGVFRSPVDVIHETTWRLPNGATLPWGVTSVIESNGFEARPFTVRHLSDDDKVRVLAGELADGHPVILLGRKDGVLHYVTMLGYDADLDVFHLYDPWHPAGNDGRTVDDNGEITGNRTLSRSELLDFWRGGGVGSFYKWYGIGVGR